MNKPLSLGQIIITILACILLLLLFVFGSVYGTPFTESWVTGASFITICMLFPALLFGIVVYTVRSGRNFDGTLIPRWQKIVGISFFTLVLGGSLFGLFAISRTAINECLSKNQQYGYVFRERPYFSGRRVTYVKMSCVNSATETIFYSFRWLP